MPESQFGNNGGSISIIILRIANDENRKKAFTILEGFKHLRFSDEVWFIASTILPKAHNGIADKLLPLISEGDTLIVVPFHKLYLIRGSKELENFISARLV
jgi:hypothetical protein